jgi:aminoglycoside 6-adenylyltransferase
VSTNRDMAQEVSAWATKNENVRAAILTSSRANPHAPVDELSDYDIELYVRDLQPFLEGDDWMGEWGEVLVREPYRPVLFDEGVRVWRLVMFKDAPRIDFNIQLLSVIEDDVAEHGGYRNDMGYVVLVDKDDLTRGAIPPTRTEYNTRRPVEADYEKLVHHFWWNVTYVAKYLHRDELLFAKLMLDGGLHHHYLSTVLSWYVGMRNSWTTNPGANGRWFKRLLDHEMWSDVEATFAGADLEDNWEAMFKTAEVFGRIAAEVGAELGYTYPAELERDVTSYLARVRSATDQR